MPTANYRILIIDDIKAIHQDFQKILSPQENLHGQNLDKMNALLSVNTAEKRKLPPFEISSAYQGSEGIGLVQQALADERPFAVAFIDVQMPPGMDGVETIEYIWKIDPNIQIVICTAYAKYSWEDILDRFGESDRLFILKKPFDTIEVAQLASSLCKKWNLSQQANQESSPLERERSRPEINEQAEKKVPWRSNLKETLSELESIKRQLKEQNLKSQQKKQDPS